MGVQVWKARKAGTLQTVAVKLISKAGKNEKDVRSLRQEIDILRKLRHPNIIEMTDAFETKTDFCVVTEFAQSKLALVSLTVPPSQAALLHWLIRCCTWMQASCSRYLRSTKRCL